MRLILLLLGAGLTCGTAAFAQSETADPSAATEGNETPEQHFKRLDQDGDDRLSSAEVRDHYVDQLLAGYDQDDDGTISRAEVEATIAEQEKQGEMTPAMARKVEVEFNTLDRDQSGAVSRQELAVHLGPLGTAVLFPEAEPQQTNIDQPVMLQQWQDLHTTGGISVMSIRF